MFTYQMTIEYDGTKFVGWQTQKNGLSIQELLEKKLSKFLKNKITVIGSGRTDAGVHARGQSAHFRIKNKIKNKKIFLNSLNFFLNKHQVSVVSIKEKTKKFHARYNALYRTYKYYVINRHATLVFEKNKAWHVKKELDINIMKKGAKILQGNNDFSTFRSSSCGAKSPIKTLKKASIKKSNKKIIFTFVSKSFLQHQVRSMVGSLKYLGEGKWSLRDFKKAFLSKKRSLCAPPAPAYGLYLHKVEY